MKKLACAVALGAAMTIGGAALANDTLEATFGNTVTATAADGTVVATYHMSSDNTFHLSTADGMMNGTWREADGQICTTVDGGEEGCADLVDGKGVGDSWTATDSSGTELTFTIIAGM